MLKEYRILKGFTQEELAEKIEISTRQLQRLEKGSDLPSFKTLQKLVLFLEINDKDLGIYIRTQEKKPKKS